LNHNVQSRGEIKLSSRDPKDPAIIDFHYLEHPFDRLVIIETVREILKFLKTPMLGKSWKGIVDGPKTESDDDIWVRFNCFQRNHM
jgi:choline dehydrogenase